MNKEGLFLEVWLTEIFREEMKKERKGEEKEKKGGKNEKEKKIPWDKRRDGSERRLWQAAKGGQLPALNCHLNTSR